MNHAQKIGIKYCIYTIPLDEIYLLFEPNKIISLNNIPMHLLMLKVEDKISRAVFVLIAGNQTNVKLFNRLAAVHGSRRLCAVRAGYTTLTLTHLHAHARTHSALRLAPNFPNPGSVTRHKAVEGGWLLNSNYVFKPIC